MNTKIINISLFFLVMIINSLNVHGASKEFEDLARLIGVVDLRPSNGISKQPQKLSTEELDALSSYFFPEEPFYDDINSYLRGSVKTYFSLLRWNSLELVKKTIVLMDSAIKKSQPIPKGIIVYRGVRLGYRGNKCFKKNENWREKAYLSTTLSIKTAQYFAFDMNYSVNAGDGAFLELHIEENVGGLLINDDEYSEEEVLLQRGLKIHITESEKRDGKCYAKGRIRL